MNDIAHNLAQVRDKISAAATRCGRSPEEITLLAVSKTKPASAIAEAIDAGQRQFGENYVQEGVDKIRHFQELGVTGLEWHFIGPLREDPDVILLGELRDSETIRLALTAAETGHLVLATLHTRGAAQAVERLVDSFPAQEKDPVRNQLAGSLRAVLSQKLEVDKQEGRVALFELLINTPAVGNLIREGKTHQLPHVIQTGQQVGMITFQQSYQHRVGEGRL
jgi:twitching motility protein PilT